MTDLDALIAAAEAEPDNETIRLVYLDYLDDRDGATDYTSACREFIAKCKEKRRYEKVRVVAPLGTMAWDERRALPGWREWLSPNCTDTLRADGWFTGGGGWPSVIGANWHRLVPCLWKHFSHVDWDRWRRVGSRIELRLTGPRQKQDGGEGHYKRCHVSLTFGAGWLRRAEFKTWRDADALLPSILADQPFAEAGIRGQPVVAATRNWRAINGGQMEGIAIAHSKGGIALHALLEGRHIGPAFKFVSGNMPLDRDSEIKAFPALTNNDAEARARLALSRALKQRARSLLASAPAPVG